MSEIKRFNVNSSDCNFTIATEDYDGLMSKEYVQSVNKFEQLIGEGQYIPITELTIPGIITDAGTINSAITNVKVTDFIDISNIETIIYNVFTINSANYVGLALYERDKTTVVARYYGTGTALVPSNAKYCRASMYSESEYILLNPKKRYLNASSIIDGTSTLEGIVDKIDNMFRPYLYLNEFTSSLVYYNKSSLVLSEGAIEIKFKMPSDFNSNRLLFSWGNKLMVTLYNSLGIYNGGGSNLLLTPSVASEYLDRTIILKLLKTLISGTSYTIDTFINGNFMSSVNITQVATEDDTNLAIGSYNGEALRLPMEFYWFKKYTSVGTLEYMIDGNTEADVYVDILKKYVGGIDMNNSSSSQQYKTYLDSIPSTLYLTTGKQFNIYLDNVIIGYSQLGYNMSVYSANPTEAQKIEARENCIRLTPRTPGEYRTTWNLYNAECDLIESKEITLKVVAENSGSGTKQIIFCGDSTIDNATTGLYSHEGPEIVREFSNMCAASSGFNCRLIGKHSYADSNKVLKLVS